MDCFLKSSNFFSIVQAVNVVFYRHLCNWIIYGDLFDIHEEFFICDAKCADENFLPSENVCKLNTRRLLNRFLIFIYRKDPELNSQLLFKNFI